MVSLIGQVMYSPSDLILILQLLVFANEHVTDSLDALRNVFIGPLSLAHVVQSLQKPAIDHSFVEETTKLAE